MPLFEMYINIVRDCIKILKAYMMIPESLDKGESISNVQDIITNYETLDPKWKLQVDRVSKIRQFILSHESTCSVHFEQTK
jgi:hypothetical protein